MKTKLVSDDKRQVRIHLEHIQAYCSRWKPGTVFDFEIVRRQPRKSDPMRKYYFAAVLPPFANELGYEVDEQELLHRQLKIVYFKVSPDDRGIYRNVPSVFSDSSDLPVDKKKEFVDWVVRKAATYGVYIEDPSST